MPDNKNRFDDDLLALKQKVEDYDANDDDAKERITEIQQDLQEYIERDYQDPEIKTLREHLLTAEVDLVERHPRLAAALRSFVAIVDNAGL